MVDIDYSGKFALPFKKRKRKKKRIAVGKEGKSCAVLLWLLESKGQPRER